jgi:hypothetical protein
MEDALEKNRSTNLGRKRERHVRWDIRIAGG